MEYGTVGKSSEIATDHHGINFSPIGVKSRTVLIEIVSLMLAGPDLL